jgi:hypothetical protein
MRFRGGLPTQNDAFCRKLLILLALFGTFLGMKITVELSQEEYEPICKMAEYCGTSPARIIEALVQGAPEKYLANESDSIWLCIIEYLRETDGDTLILKRIQFYQDAIQEHQNIGNWEEFKRTNFGQYASLAAFEAWQNGRFNRN